MRCEALESREVPALNPTGFEQEMLELLNRMRMDPQGELGRMLTSINPPRSADFDVDQYLQYFNVNGTVLQQQWSTLAAVPPLAWNEKLINAALGHNNTMIQFDQQSHQLPGEPSFDQRISNAGYTTWNYVAENIFAFAESPFHAHAGFAIDWGFTSTGIQSPPGHRLNMMSSSVREIGISIVIDENWNTQVGPFVVTQDFARRADQGNPWLVGVIFTDANSTGWYEAGEGAGGITVSVTGTGGSFSTTTMTAGGYQLQLPAGSYTITMTGGGLNGSITKNVTVGSANVKVDARTTEAIGGGTGDNHAPILNTAYNAIFSSIGEDTSDSAGNTVAQVVGTSITDSDTGALRGIAVIGSGNNGTWQYSLDNGGSWQDLGTVNANSARLLRDTDLLRFIPNADFSGSSSLTYRAWDQTTGSPGESVDLSSAASFGGSTAFSFASDSASITVTPVNDAPRINAGATFTLPSVSEDATTATGTTIGTLLGTKVSDPDAGFLKGIAVVGFSGATGNWQYSINNGTTWTSFGTPSEAAARLLRDTDLVRFIPSLNMNGSANLSFRVWDRTAGTAGSTANLSSVGGTSAYSQDLAAAVLGITPVNDAPVLSANPAFNFPNQAKGNTNPAGTPVSALIAGSLTDIDPNALRGAAFFASTGTGNWQFSRNGGQTWTNFGILSSTAARLLGENDLVRFVPAATFGGVATISFRGWDQSSGSAGTTANISLSTSWGGTKAYSVGTKSASVFINGAPVVNSSGSATLPTILEDNTTNTGALISTFIGTTITDTDTGAVKSIAVSGLGGIPGTWQYSTTGTTWTTITSVSESSALLLKLTYRLRFIPAANANGQATLIYHGWDQTSGTALGRIDLTQNGSTGGATAFSVGTVTGKITVTAVNDAPVLTTNSFTLPDLARGTTSPDGISVTDLLGSNLTDADSNALRGIAVTSLSGITSGTGQYSIKGGTSWVNFGAVSTAASRLLRGQDLIRFVPNSSFVGQASFSFRGWDQSSGVAGGTVNLGGTLPTIGGSFAYSQVLATARVNVV